MPSKSVKQAKVMSAISHGWRPSGKAADIPVKVAKEFHAADAGHKYGKAHRSVKRYAEGGAEDIPAGSDPSFAPGRPRVYIAPPAETPPPADAGWGPPAPVQDNSDAMEKAYLKKLTGTETPNVSGKGEAGGDIISRMARGIGDWITAPGKAMEGPEQVQRADPNYETEEENFLQQLNDQRYAEQNADWAAGTAAGQLGVARMPGMVPEGAIGAGGSGLAKKPVEGKFFHPYDLDPSVLKNAKQISGAKGSNPGGMYELADGTPVYMKTPPTPEHTYNEKLATELYKLAGVPVADVRMTKFNGQPSIASPVIPGKVLNELSPQEMAGVKDLAAHYPVDLWLGNYDWVGTGKDNVIVDPTGRAHRIDMGGALRFRAQGALKNESMWGPKVEHFDMQKSPDMADVLTANAESGGPAAKRVAAITDDQIKGLVDKFGPLAKGEKEKLFETLKARRDGVAKLYPYKPELPQAPPTPKDNVAHIPMTPKKMAKYLENATGDPEVIAKYIHATSKTHGKAFADKIGQALSDNVKWDVGHHLDALEAAEHQDAAQYAMNDDRYPEMGPEGWGDEYHGSQVIHHGDRAWWHNTEPVPAGKAHDKASLRGLYSEEFAKANEGKSGAIRKINDWSQYHLPYETGLQKPKPTQITLEQAQKLGFNPNFELVKGTHTPDYPHEIEDPKSKTNTYQGEKAIYFFPHDLVHTPDLYGQKSKPYMLRAQNAYEAYYPRLAGRKGQPETGESYKSYNFKALINAAHEHNADVLILHGVADIGAKNQTQILVLSNKGTLRALNAKFNPADLQSHSLNAAKPLYGMVGGIPFAYDALKKMNDGKDEDKKMASGGKTKKFKPFSSIEIKGRKTPKTVINENKAAKNSVKHYAKGGKVDYHPEDHEFINFKKGGMIDSDIPGRTDKIPMKVATGAYVLPADIPSALGQGNTKAGKSILDKMFNSGPQGMTPMKSKSAANSGKGLKFLPPAKVPKADGGETDGDDEHVPIVAAGGEYIIHPDKVREVGHGDMSKGHKVLDKFVLHTRAEHIKTLKGLKPPK